MILDMLTLIFLSCIAATLSYFLDYCFGKPGSEDEVNPNAIFFFWTYFLAKRRLSKTDCTLKNKSSDSYIKQNIISGFKNQLNDPDCIIRASAKKQLKRDVVYSGRELFTWEYAIGMCLFCTNFWISILFVCLPVFLLKFIVLSSLPNFYILLCPPLFSHFILRKI